MSFWVFLMLFVFERGRARERENRQRERRERIPSRLYTVSAKPDTGLELTNHEIMHDLSDKTQMY